MSGNVVYFASRGPTAVMLLLCGPLLLGCGRDGPPGTTPLPTNVVAKQEDGQQQNEPKKVARKDMPILDVTFKDVEFEIEKGGKFKRSMLTDKINEMFGRRIRIRGFMLSSIHRQGLARFILLQNSNCPFGGPEAYLYHNIQIDLDNGQTTSYTVNPVTVEGVLTYRPLPGLDEDEYLSIYHIQAAKVY